MRKNLLASSSLILLALFGLGACAAEIPPVIVEDPPAEEEIVPEPEVEAPEIEWVTFTDDRIPHSFEVPEVWDVEFVGGEPSENIYTFEVLDEFGDPQIFYFNWLIPDPITCSDQSLAIEVTELDVTPLSDPSLKFVYRVAYADGYPYVGSLAVAATDLPNPGGSCVFSNISGAQMPGLFADVQRVSFLNPEHFLEREFDTFEEAESFMQTEEYEIIKRILTSLKTK